MMALQYQDGYYFDLEAFQREFDRLERLQPLRTIIYRSGRRPWPEPAPYHIPPIEPLPVPSLNQNMVDSIGRINAWFEEVMRIPEDSILLGSPPSGVSAHRVSYNRLEPGQIFRFDPVCPEIPDIDKDRVYARRLIGGRMYRQRVRVMNAHGQVMYESYGKPGLCMAVVKNDSVLPDWDWRAMQKGENWCAPPRKHWTERIT